MKRAEKGFSIVESMIAIGVAAVIMAFIMPNFRDLTRTFRRDGAAARIAGDVRKARARAIATGWQYRVIGFNVGATSPYKNQYRLMARSSSAVAWPSTTAAQMESSTQMVGAWFDMTRLFPGVSINSSDVTPDFYVTFDSRGVRIDVDASFDPLVVSNQTGATKSVRISAVGNVGIQ